MIGELEETNWKLQKSLISLHTHSLETTTAMEARVRKPPISPTNRTAMSDGNNPSSEGMRQVERDWDREQDRERNNRHIRRSVTYGNVKKGGLKSSYFSAESMLLLVCLTASLLILPLILPPLPPPPFLLLLLPIGILVLLVFLAFMPSNVRDLTYTYM